MISRIVLGGKFGPTLEASPTEESYRIPGVLEEVLLSVQAGQPVFLIGSLGGVARLVIDIL